jgi:hypothetical protein
MPDFGTANSAAISLAGGALTGCLIEVLAEDGLITYDQARRTLLKANAALAAHAETPDGIRAREIIVAMLITKFPERS